MPIELALLGCGHPDVADMLGVLASEPDLRLAAVWDADPVAVPGPIASAAVASVSAAVARAHAVVICAPTDQRPALCVQAARAGRPILVEPPLALSAVEARAVAREIERSRTPARAVAFLRQLPALHRLRALLAERVLGRLASVSAASARVEDRFVGPLAWMLDPRRAGVGGFGALALPLLDALAALAPDAPPALAAVTLTRGSGDVDIGGIALGTCAGAPLSVRAGWGSRPGGLELAVAGTAGTATIREGVLELERGEGNAERWVGPPPDAGEAVRVFAAELRSRRFGREGLAPAVEAQRLLEAAVRIT